MKALFFDIDGTLLSEITKEIPHSALDALKKTAEKGNLTFINTGRTWSELPEELKKLPFSGWRIVKSGKKVLESSVRIHS